MRTSSSCTPSRAAIVTTGQLTIIDALIFDFDGVIIDTETPSFTTWQQEFQAHRVELDRALWSNIIGGGRSRFEVYRHLEELVGRDLDEEVIRAEP